MVAKEYNKSCGPGLNNERCELHLPFAQQPFSASLLQKSGRNKLGLGNNSGIFGSWCHKRNTCASGETSYPLVCDQKRRKTQIDYQLQRAQPLLGAKTFQIRKLAGNFSLFKERTKIDLKHAYFHLQIAAGLKPYMCIQVEQNVFQFQAACFGLSILPQHWQSVMTVLLNTRQNRAF